MNETVWKQLGKVDYVVRRNWRVTVRLCNRHNEEILIHSIIMAETPLHCTQKRVYAWDYTHMWHELYPLSELN